MGSKQKNKKQKSIVVKSLPDIESIVMSATPACTKDILNWALRIETDEDVGR